MRRCDRLPLLDSPLRAVWNAVLFWLLGEFVLPPLLFIAVFVYVALRFKGSAPLPGNRTLYAQ